LLNRFLFLHFGYHKYFGLYHLHHLEFGEDFAESAAATGVSYENLVRRIVSIGLAYRPEWRMFEP
jgi:hypothetical protein